MNIYKHKNKIIGFILLFTIVIFSCNREQYAGKSDLMPTFSVDTVQFDTVFQSIGSATQYFVVKNLDDKVLHINSVELARGNNSPFRINFNGKAASFIKDVDIPPKDSVYVFAEVTVNPAENALLEKDSIVFNVNGKQSDVKLIAYGQDIHLLNDSVVGTTVFTADKPYLIVNSMAVDKNQTLTIEAGCQLHFSRKSRLIVLGTILAEGTPEAPIVFQGDRLEHVYDDVSGQWEGIWLTKFSKNNFFNYTQIKNAEIGIQVDSVQNSNPMLTIFNTRIEHHSRLGIYAQMTTILAANLLVADCRNSALALTRGGGYRFYNSTIANYWRTTVRVSPSLVLNNYLVHDGTAYIYDLNEAYFGNCIITGAIENEIEADLYEEGVAANYIFDNCILKISDENDINTEDETHFISPFLNINPKFTDVYKYDFSLDTLSPAKDIAKPEIIDALPSVLQFDILHQSRLTDNAPDLGAYERVE